MNHSITIETSTGQERFNYLPVIKENIPHNLTEIPNWVLWFAAQPLDIEKTKKPDKIPLTPSLYAAKTNTPKSWGSFNQVMEAYNQHKGQEKTLTIYGKQRRGIISGIGFVLTPELGITGIDSDKCLQDGKLNLFAQEIVERLNTYTEVSPSGTGIRAFVYAKKPDGGCKHTDTGFEIYNHGRYLTVTGQKIHGDTIVECQSAVDDLHKDIFKPKKKYEKRHVIPEKSINEILKIAFANEKNGKEIENLYNGIFPNDQSTADMAFCNHLAFWFGKNFSTMDAVFRTSALMRPKWDRVHVVGQTYGAHTLQKAIDECKDVYKGREFDPVLGKYLNIAKEAKIEAPPQLLDELDSLSAFDFPDTTEKFKPLSTKENLQCLLMHYGIKCKYNEIKKNIEIDIPWAKYSDDNKMNCAIAEIISLCAKNSMPKTEVQDYITLIASKNCYNPVADWISSKSWDGIVRIEALCNTISSSMEEKYKNKLIFRWLLSCVAAVFVKDFTSHGVLVFVGEQGVGKTSWFKRLAETSLNAVLEGAIIDAMNKDTIINATSHWLVELGELDATFRKSDISRLKAFVTQTNDKIRQPYARTVSEYPRRTVFFGSVNESHYLVDDTGNRRWWTIPVTSIDYTHNIDMQQVWAELKTYLDSGEKWWLEDDEFAFLNSHNEDYQQLDPIEEKILSSYDASDTYNMRHITATDVLIELGFEKPNKAQVNIASKVITKFFGTYTRKKGGRVFYLPPKKGVTN